MCFLQAGVAPADVGVIALYNEQVRLIRDVMTSQQQRVSGGGGGGSDVEVNTVDRYQGRDKSVVMMSFVKHVTSTQVRQLSGFLFFLKLVWFKYRRNLDRCLRIMEKYSEATCTHVHVHVLCI